MATEIYVHDVLLFAFPFTVPTERRLAVVLGAYFDASGNNPSDECLVLAGFVSTPERWAQFSVAWKALVNDEWSLPYFRMSDFENRMGPYKNWSDKERHDRLNQLLELINQHVIASVATGVPMAEFRKYSTRKDSESSYFLAAILCFIQTEMWHRPDAPDRNERIAFVFESGDRGWGEVKRVYDQAYNNPEHRQKLRMMSLISGSKEEFEPLQAADILAYELYKQWPRQFGDEKRPERYPLKQLAKIPKSWYTMDEAQMVDLSARMRGDKPL